MKEEKSTAAETGRAALVPINIPLLIALHLFIFSFYI